MGEFTHMIKEDYGMKKKPMCARNPQANAIVERAHQTLTNMVRTMRPHEMVEKGLTPDQEWEGILSAVGFAMKATVHTTLQATPAQLVFGRDAILNIKFKADWQRIKERKQKLIRKNNQRENAKRKEHTHKVGDKVLTQV